MNDRSSQQQQQRKIQSHVPLKLLSVFSALFHFNMHDMHTQFSILAGVLHRAVLFPIRVCVDILTNMVYEYMDHIT